MSETLLVWGVVGWLVAGLVAVLYLALKDVLDFWRSD